MERTWMLAIAAVVVAAGTWVVLNRGAAEEQGDAPHRVDWYLATAAKLQALDQKKAIEQLRTLANDPKEGQKVFALCRMLFTNKPGAEFQSPALGAPVFLAGSNYADWPLQPIVLVDGVPFYIVW